MRLEGRSKGGGGGGRTGVVGNELGDPALVAARYRGALGLEIRERNLGVA